MSNASDFIIEDGVLTEYVGPGGDVVIPEGVTSIGDEVFCWCMNPTSVVIPAGVTSIGDKTFWNCRDLTSAVIPGSVTHIGKYAFRNCRFLTIHAPAGSYAERYAKENNIPFVAE